MNLEDPRDDAAAMEQQPQDLRGDQGINYQPPVQQVMPREVELVGPRRHLNNLLEDLMDIVRRDDMDDNNEVLGKFLLERLFLPRRDSTIVRVLFALWMLILLAASSFHVPGLVYVFFMVIPVLCSWYPKLDSV